MEQQPFLVGVCGETSFKVAINVRDRLSDNMDTVQHVDMALRTMGHHGPIVLRSDGESSLHELLTNVANGRNAQTLVEHGARQDSQGNGRAERAVKSIEGQVRVLKTDLEQRTGEALPQSSPVFDWLVRHAADLVNKREVGRDRMTPWQRLRGCVYSGELLPFGCAVLHRLSGKMRGGVLVDRWSPGHWIGKTAKSDEHLVAMTNGNVIRTRSVRQMDTPILPAILGKIKPWSPGRVTTANLENLDDGQGMASRPPERGAPDNGPRREDEVNPALRSDEVVEPGPQERNTRAWRITPQMLVDHGFTPQCRGCDSVRRGKRDHKGHSTACRARLEEILKDDGRMKIRFEESRSRREQRHAHEPARHEQEQRHDSEPQNR